MINDHGTACQCSQCQMHVQPMSTTVPLNRPSPPAEPKCENCEMDGIYHELGCPTIHGTTKPAESEGKLGPQLPSFEDEGETLCDNCGDRKIRHRRVNPHSPISPCRDCNRCKGFVYRSAPAEPAESEGKALARGFLRSKYESLGLKNFGSAERRWAEDLATFAEQYATKQIERQTPAIIERYKRESGFDAIKFNGETAEQILREQGIYVADDGVTVNTQVETLVKALEKIGQCGAGHVCCNVNFHIAQNAIQTVNARRSGGEGK